MKNIRDTMNTNGNLGLIAGILLVIFMLIGATAASVIMNGSGDVSEQDYTQMVNEVVDELSTYIQIKDIIGKYELIQGEYTIQKIAVMIRPLISTTIGTSTMSIKISNGEHLNILFPSGQAAFIGSHSLFDHPLWKNTTQGTFSFLVIIDDDHSLLDYRVINKNTDTAFIIINLPNNLYMKNGDTMTLTLLPAPGTQRTVTLEAPLPTMHVVSLYE